MPPGLNRTHLEDLLAEAPDDVRFHISRGAGESFANTLPLLHPRGYLEVQDIFVADMDDYRKGFRGPGKLDGSLVVWVNGALLRAVGARAGYDVHFAPFPYRPGHEDHDSLHDPAGLVRLWRAHDRERTIGIIGMMTSSLPILPTTVIGSYSMPEWLERAKNDYLSRRVSRRDLDEMHDAVRKAAIKDQEVAGVDIVSDGEAQRDNMIDYFTERLPGVQIDLGSKRFYYDFYESVVRSKLATGSMGLADEARFLTRFTGAPAKISVSGPHTLVKRIQNKHYPSEEAFALDLGRVLNFELKELVRAGVTELQIDEPYYSGFPGRPALGAQGHQRDGRGREGQHHAAHLLRQPLRQAVVRGQLPLSVPGDPRGQGRRRCRSSSRAAAKRTCSSSRSSTCRSSSGWASSTSRRRTSSRRRSSPTASAARSKSCPPRQLVINPDCGCVRLPRDVAFNKLSAMVEGTRIVRKELGR